MVRSAAMGRCFLFLCLVVPATAAAEESATRTARLVIDFGDGVERHYTRLAWHEGLTVLDLVLAANKHPRGIDVAYRGKKATAFIYRLGDLRNERSGRAWIYRVNGKLADRSCGVCRVEAGDTVLWTFQKYP